MELNDRAVRTLVELGFTEYEIKVYTTLLYSGTLTASDVSKAANVPFSKVYDILNSLEEKGWIDDDGERPSKYYASDPVAALNIYKTKMDRSFENSKQEIIDQLKPIYEKKEMSEKPDIWILKGESNVISKIMDMSRKTSVELKVAMPSVTSSQLIQLAEFLNTVKPIRYLFLLGDTAVANMIKKGIPRSEVRIRSEMFGGGVISDQKEVVLLLGKGDDVSPYLAIWSEHPGLALLADSYFKYLWEGADKLNLM